MAQATEATVERPVRYRWWGLGVIALAQLMVMLDMTIVNIALPWAQQDTGMSDVSRQWVVTAYTLAFGALLLLGGRVGDLVGRKRAFVAGAVGFAVASVVGGAAPNAEVLVAARAAQGVFAALLVPSTLAMLATTFTEPRERAKAFGVFSSVAGVGSAVGLLGGGVITEYLDWRWCFYVNVPIGAAVVAGAWLLLPAVPAIRQRVDVPGAVLSALGMLALVYAFDQAATHSWTSARVLGCLAAALVLLAAFGLAQAKGPAPLLPLRLVADRNRAGASLTIALAMVSLFGLFLILTYQLQVVMDFSPMRTGLAILPATVATVLTSTRIAARLVPRVPLRWLVVPGLLIAMAGLLNLGRLTPDSSYVSLLMPTQILLGIGVGLVMSPCISAATYRVPPQEMGVVSAFVSTSQQLGGSIGTALLNAIATSVTAGRIAGRGSGGRAVTEATVHGYAVASLWAAGITAVAAVLAGLLITVDLRKPAPAAAPQVRDMEGDPAPSR
ncbi:DHA2 family efflux MFS transporter permease subunit [Streptomyces sp. ICN441]|uniref:MFS transporter n=1 Tax=Streptomyces sp. ICN441 TaxID=2558286 RepID=UPI00106C94C0|nr:MFS transporter [Streptomyces sp. ICN441]TFE36252.1 DHA2 family efflux MFS transporter permease subunit [Streptomyces sp. ICN441]